jgi:hypothetical protein
MRLTALFPQLRAANLLLPLEEELEVQRQRTIRGSPSKVGSRWCGTIRWADRPAVGRTPRLMIIDTYGYQSRDGAASSCRIPGRCLPGCPITSRSMNCAIDIAGIGP